MTRIVGALIFLLSMAAIAGDESFSERVDKAWLFYNEPPPEPEEIEEEEPEAPPPSPSAEPEEQKPERFSVEWFKKNFDRIKNEAIDDPNDDQKMLRFKIAERVMMDKASNFAIKNSEMLIKHPYLDARNVRPISNGAVNVREYEVEMKRRSFFSGLGKKASLWFFYSSTCSYCVLQSKSLKVIKKYIPVYAISVDGNPPNFKWEDEVYYDPNISIDMEVDTTPSLFFVTSEGRYLLSSNSIALPEIENRVIYFSKRLGLINVDNEGIYNVNRSEYYFDEPSEVKNRKGIDINELFESAEL